MKACDPRRQLPPLSWPRCCSAPRRGCAPLAAAGQVRPGGTTQSTTTLSASSPVTAGDTDTLTATVSPTAATGTVNFLSSGSSIGTGTLTSGSATSSPTFATAGTYTVTADYGGDSTYASSTSAAVTITATALPPQAPSQPGVPDSAHTSRATNLVPNPANMHRGRQPAPA